ncbi:MAG: class I SAM-dependent RNA methyltransferase [Hyphomicrobiales bacterium]
MAELRLEIAGMGRRGEGIAHGDGGTLFIPYALPGESVRAEVDGERVRIVAIESSSSDRVDPFCKFFTRCGGCQLQHWHEEPYRQWKRGLVVTALKNRGLEAPVAELIDAHGEGRRRVSLHVRRKDGKVLAGFMAARSHDLLDIDRCPILVPALQGATDIARAIGERLGDCDVALTATDTGIDGAVKVERKLAGPVLHGLAQAELGLARLTVNGDPIATRTTPMVTMGRAKVALPPVSFLQATVAGEAALARLVISAAGRAKKIADLFCGVGPFALRLAETAQIAAFDSDRPAIAALDRARRETSGLKPVTAMARDLVREPLVANELKDFDAVIFDPPRAGAEAQARQLAKSNVGAVIAVACEPASFARDAEILMRGGYALRSVTPVDQFKWSSHVETVAVFQRSPLR